MKKCMMALAVAALGLVAALAAPASADTTVSVQSSSKSGVTPTRTNSGLVAASNYKFRNDGRTMLMFLKTGAGSATISIGVASSVAGLAVSSQTVTVAATTGDKVIGPFPTRIFNDANGDVHFTISDTVGLSMAAIKF